MAQGRSLETFERVYISGYDMSGYLFNAGERGADYTENDSGCFSDLCTGTLSGKPKVAFGPLNGVFDNTPTNGLHVVETAAQGALQYVSHFRGARAAPAIGDDAFCAPLMQNSYKSVASALVNANVTFAGLDATAGLNYDEFWGRVIHAFGSETGANAANTNADNGAASAAGGWLMYHIYSITGAGTVTLSIDESATGIGAWGALAGATTGAIATASAPTAGIVQLATNAAVKQYLRWQLAFGGASTACKFTLAFMRGR